MGPELRCIGIVSPGDMGHAVGALLARRGLRVVTTLEGRSEATRDRARRAGLEDLAGLDALLDACDTLLAILPPAEAPGLAARVAAALKNPGRSIVYADCNAVSPATARRIGQQIEAAGGVFVDASLIGLPPGRGPAPTRLYASGVEAERLAFLTTRDDAGALEVRVLGPGTGAASALKMAYAGLTKGAFTLHAAALALARRTGLWDELVRELEASQPDVWRRMQILRFLPADSGRWIGEMQEIAATFRENGLPGGFHEAAEQVFRALAATPYARETRETLDPGRSLETTIAALSDALDESS